MWLWPVRRNGLRQRLDLDGRNSFSIALLVLGVSAVVWLGRSLSRGGGYPPPIERHVSALDILEQRYAKGEIQRDEYLQKKGDLGG